MTNHEILAIAIVRPFPGHEEEVQNVLRELYELIQRKGYGRNYLYVDTVNLPRLVNLRYWSSEEARREAAEDPEMHRYWHRLGTICEVEKVYEKLIEIPLNR